jgi:hypothetical protein
MIAHLNVFSSHINIAVWTVIIHIYKQNWIIKLGFMIAEMHAIDVSLIL